MLKLGSEPETGPTAVKHLQLMLNQRGGFPVLVEDGEFGSSTESSVKHYQQNENLVVDGVVGKQTRIQDRSRLGVSGTAVDNQLSQRSRRLRVPPARKASNHDELRAASEGVPAQGAGLLDLPLLIKNGPGHTLFAFVRNRAVHQLSANKSRLPRGWDRCRYFAAGLTRRARKTRLLRIDCRKELFHGALATALDRDGQAGVAQVIAVDQNDDLALLKLERRTETTAAFRIGRPLRAGESAVVFGFPLSRLLASTGNVTTGVVTALAGPLDDPHQIQISAPVQSGNSGGPVLDARGSLIGVVVSKLNSALGQNVNFAIKASTAANFLDAHGIAYKSAAGENELPIPDIVAQARDFSVQVLCQD
jgi:hypothetical protein